MDIDAEQMKRGKIWLLYYHPARTIGQYEGFLRQFLPVGLPRKRIRPTINDMVYFYQMLQPIVFRVVYKSAASMILSRTTLSEQFMLHCALLVYETKLRKQTIASLSSDKERIKLLNNWAQGVYSLEKQDSESLSDASDDLEEEN
eukprot:6194131-Pleurochrysis_carterae.AAC.1